jgi:hypothetical protein
MMAWYCMDCWVLLTFEAQLLIYLPPDLALKIVWLAYTVELHVLYGSQTNHTALIDRLA